MKVNKTLSLQKRQLAVLVAVLAASSQVSAQSEDIDELVVVGNRAALMRALDRQRNSDQVTGVVDSDALGNFADINVSESLRRISGIMVENDQGEGRYVSVRGMNTDLNAMTINGVSTASPEDRRGIMLDGVPTDMLDSMTVYKTLNPSMDADTIGGAINLETFTAFRQDGFFARLKAETSYNELTEDGSNPTLSATISNRFKVDGGELGAALILSDQERHIESHNNENGGWSETAPNDDYEMRYYDLTRERQGVVLNIDYQGDNGNSYFAHMFHNEYTDIEYRGKWEIRDGIEDNDPTVNGNVFTYADTKMDNEARHREEVRQISALQLGAEFNLGQDRTLSMELFGSEAEQDDGDKWAVIYRSDTIDAPVTYDNSNPKKPVIGFPAAFYDPATFNLKVHEREYSLTQDEDIGAKIDYTAAFDGATEMQVGMKFRSREKTNDFNFCGYEPIDDISLADTDFATIDPYLNSVHGPAPTISNVRSYTVGSGFTTLSDGTTCPDVAANFEFSGDEEEESIPADWKTEEDIFSAYAMATTTTDNAVMVYGVRYENTSSTYRGKSFDDDGFAGITVQNKDYDFWAPSFNLKYNLADDRIARLGIFRSLVRPGFGESGAYSIINTEDNEIEGGNPQLDPTTAWNLDLTYEWYAGEETFIGAGLFYKRIEDSIIAVESNDFAFRGNVWDTAETFINGDSSSIAGLEFSAQTAMDNGLVFVFNYTYADGETDLPADSVNGQRTIPYLKQAQDTANFVVGYDKNALDIRLALNYRSDYLDEVGDDEINDRYTSAHMQVDLTARYEFSENLLITGAALNLNDRPEYYYFGNESRLSQYDEYGQTYTLGFRYVF